MKLKSIGKLKPHPDTPDEWLISELIAVPFFDGKNFAFSFYNDFYIDGVAKFERAIQNFLSLSSSEKQQYSDDVYRNYLETKSHFQYQSDTIPPFQIENANEIWNYVYPHDEILVEQNALENNDVYFVIECECQWEEEHGLQLVFKQGLKLTRVSQYDGHLR